eukprot:scaffold91_cov254-Pinguiococcus_pyrenoidosus.AAC.23
MNPDEPELVSETLLKQRRQRERSKAALSAAAALKRGKRRRSDKEPAFRRPETYVQRYLKAEQDDQRARRNLRLTRRRQALRKRRQDEPQDSSVVFAVLVRDSRDASPKVKKILRTLRLRLMLQGVFLKLDNTTEAMLSMVKPYIAHGRPSFHSVNELIRKKGIGRPNLKGRGRVPLSDNTVIEKSFLGEIGIICVEDLVHEISTCGDNFAKAAKFLYPFQLTKVGDGIQRHMLNEKKHNKGGEVDMDAFINDAL